MPEQSGVYDSFVIQPVCKIKENVAVWTSQKWRYYRVDFIEGMPAGPASQVDMVAVAIAAGQAITSIAANGTITKLIVPALQVNDNEILHLRWEPIDYVEGVLWEQASQLRNTSRGIASRVDKSTRSWDPCLASTTFWILGMRDRDAQVECRNPTGYAQPQARFQFFGDRMVVDALTITVAVETLRHLNLTEEQVRQALDRGDPQVVKQVIGPVTWIPAEGKAS